MPIQLSQEERAFLEQFVRPYKPTKRQRAKALLGLAADEVPEVVAASVGIPKEVVLELAARFAERGLAGVGLVTRPEIVVTLVQDGATVRRYQLPEVPEHAAVPSLQNDLNFEQYRDILKARRAERAREEDSA